MTCDGPEGPGTAPACKCCFPPCAVFLNQGCDKPVDILGAYCLGCCYTMACWKPANTKGAPKEDTSKEAPKQEEMKEAPPQLDGEEKKEEK